MSSYTYTVLNESIFMKADAWVDDPDVDATIVFGLRHLDGSAITNGTAEVTVNSLAPILYTGELDISGLGLTEGARYDLFIELQVARVSASPSPSVFEAHMQRITLNADVLTESDKSFAFQSQASGADEVFFAGGYNLFSGNDNLSGVTSFGTANVSYAAHFFVVLGETPVDEITITVTGVSINDQGTRNGADSEDIIIPAASSIDDYFETEKKWLGTVGLLASAGTPKQVNYGYSKYWDNNNDDFTLLGFDATWFGGASDDVDLVIYHHKAAGWTYNAGSEPSPPEVLRMTDDHTVTDDKTASGAFGAWKRDNLSTTILGSASCGMVLSAISSKASSFQIGNFVVRIRS